MQGEDSMEIYTVKKIQEADYGCEETGRSGPAAVLRLESCDREGTFRDVEVLESVLAEQGITEGKKVCFTPSGEIRNYIRVVAAVICDHMAHKTKIFSTARGYGAYKGWWEFPGGKIEAGETPQQALAREIREELTAEIVVGDLIHTIEYDYPEFHLSMDCFYAEVKSGHLELKEAEQARWLTREDLDDVNWLPADQELVDLLRKEWE